MRKQKSGAPKDPKFGRLWFEPYTKTMRVWNGKRWHETTPKEINDMILKHGSLAKWMAVEYGDLLERPKNEKS